MGKPEWKYSVFTNGWSLKLGPWMLQVFEPKLDEVTGLWSVSTSWGACLDLADGKRQALAAARKLHRELGEALDAAEAQEAGR